jgi:hypothetical protein
MGKAKKGELDDYEEAGMEASGEAAARDEVADHLEEDEDSFLPVGLAIFFILGKSTLLEMLS